MDAKKKEWLRKQVEEYEKERGNYEVYAENLAEILKKACAIFAPLAIVEARAKSLESLAEKAVHKAHKYNDPAHQLTDLCGARVITHTQAQADGISRFIRENFDVDEANSLDARTRLKATEFGYRSSHYVVQVRRKEILGVASRDEIGTRKAEIQVRTLLQHAWSEISHDRLYKTRMKVPEFWEREGARVAALLEQADGEFGQLVDALDAYLLHYDAYMSSEQMRDEIDKWETILPHSRNNAELVHKIARLAIALEDWDKAAAVLQDWKNEEMPEGWEKATVQRWRRPKVAAVLRDLGVAKIKAAQKERKKRRKEQLQREGRDDLVGATHVNPEDAEARCALADTYCPLSETYVQNGEQGLDRHATALEQYELAFQADPSNVRALSSYLECRTHLQRNAKQKSTSIVPLLRPSLEAAIGECYERARVGVYLPQAFYDIGKFALLLGRPYESLGAYAKAVYLSESELPIDKALTSLTKLQEGVGNAASKGELLRFEWARRFLLLAKLSKLMAVTREGGAAAQEKQKQVRKVKEELAELDKKPKPAFKTPVVIVAGGCDVSVDERMQSYSELLEKALDGFRGTIVCGGTTAGISGLVGNLPNPGGLIRKIAYLPTRRTIPKGVHVHSAYEKRSTKGNGFSALEPLQNWIDLLVAGLKPWDVRLLGINGGQIAAFEFRLALAMGAEVGIVESSGRAASDLLPANDLWKPTNLLWLPDDAMSLRALLVTGRTRMDAKQLEAAGRAVHAKHVIEVKKSRVDPPVMPWEKLRDDFKKSSRLQAAYAEEILRSVGYGVRRAKGRIKLPKFSDHQVEIMAEMEHGRWNVERLREGWTYGPVKDANKKISPYLVSWEKVPRHIQKFDLEAVRNYPRVLAKAGLEVYKIPKAKK